MEKIALWLVVEEYFQDVVKDLLLDHVFYWHRVFSLDYCLEEFDDLHIGLYRLVAVTVSDFEQDLLVHEEHAELIGVHIVNDKLVEELQDQDATLVNLLSISRLYFWVNCLSRILALLLFIFHFSVGDPCLAIFSCKYSSSFRLFYALHRVIFGQEFDELGDNLEQYYLLEVLLHFWCFLARQVLEELTNANFYSLLARIHHMLGEMAQENVVVFLLMIWAEEFSNCRVIDIVEQDEQVVEDFDRVRL